MFLLGIKVCVAVWFGLGFLFAVTRRRERRGEGTGNLQKGKRRPAQADLNAYARKYLA